MRFLWLFLISLASVQGIEVRLRAPAAQGGGETLGVSTYSQTTPVQLTFEQAHDLKQGDTIHCVGMRGNPRLRGFLKVQAVLSSVAITVSNPQGVPIAGTTGSGVDIDNAHDGVQLGYCGKVTNVSLRDHPRAIWPLPGSPQETRMLDPDGPGPLLAPVAADDPAGWEYLVSRNEAIATPAGCDGKTPSLCPIEEQFADNPPDRVAFGYGLAMLAAGWKMDNTRVHWKNAAIYYLNNFHKGFPPSRPCFDCFTGHSLIADGDDTEYASFAINGFGWAYSMLRNELTPEQRETFLRKVWNTPRTNCVNSLSSFGGSLTGDGTELTTPDAGTLQPGDTIHIRTAIRQYSVAGGDLLDITVSGTTATLRFAPGVPMPRTGTVQIAGSGNSNLDGWFMGTISGQTLTFTTSAAPGVYSGQGMRLMSPGAGGDRARAHWVQVVAVDRSKTPQVVKVNMPITTVAYNSPYARSEKNWDNSFCGVVWMTCHHESHDIFPNYRTAKPAASMTVNQNFIILTPDSWPEFEDLTPPYIFRIGEFELAKAVGVDPAARKIFIERAQNWTAPGAHSVGVEAFYSPDIGSTVGLSTDEVDMMVGNYSQNKTNSFIPPLLILAMATAGDAPEAEWFLEYYWNLYYDYYWRIHKRLFAGPNYAGPGNMGYVFGRWADNTSMLALAALNSLVPAIDLRFSGQRDVAEWNYTIARPGDTNTHMAWGDPAPNRAYERDDIVTLWCNQYLYPSAPETQRALDFYYREWNWLAGAPPEEWILFRLLYTSSASPRIDYRTGPTARMFDQKEPGINSICGGLHSRTSWTDPLGTLLWAPVVAGGDHNGAYIFPGLVLIAKGKTDMISGSTVGSASGNDVRTQYALQTLKANALSISSGQNASLGSATLRLGEPAPAGGAVIELQTDSDFLITPRYVTIPEGATSATVPVRGFQTPVAVTASVSARGQNTVTSYFRVNLLSGAVSPVSSTIASVTLAGPVTAGHYAEGTITLAAAAPTGGVSVQLSSNHPGVVLPGPIRIRAGIASTPFFVSVAPGASGNFTITATSLNSAVSAETAIAPAAPGAANVVHFGLTTTDLAQGGLRVDGHGRSISRSKIGADFAYMRSDNSNVYDKGADVATVSEAHRDILHLKPETGQDYVLTYDRILHGKPGHQDILRIPFHRMSHVDGSIPQNPPPVYQRVGNQVSFASLAYGTSVNTKVLWPADPSVMTDDTSSQYATRLTVYGGQEAEKDFVVVSQPCGTIACTPPNWRLIPSSEGQRVLQIDDPDRTWIVSFTKETKATVRSLNLQAQPYAGTARFVITGLTSVSPFTRYSVLRDGNVLLDEAQVETDGTLRFSAGFGTGGAFTITSTGTAPLEILTLSLPQATTGQPYNVTLTGQGGEPPYAWSVASGSLCAGLSLTGSQLQGTPASAGTCSFGLRLSDQAGEFAARSYSLTVKAPALALDVATTELPAAWLGEPYAAALAASGGEPPYTWNIATGALPAGTSLSAGGAVTGTPSAEGDFPFVARVTDSKGSQAAKTLQLRVSSIPLTLETAALPVAYSNTPYEVQLTATGGLPPYNWTLLSGELPAGFTLDPSGLLAGMSPRGWSGQIAVRVQDWTGRTADRTFVLGVRNSPGVLSVGLVTASRTRIAIRYGRYGLQSHQSCQLELSSNAGFTAIVESKADGGGGAFRNAVFGETAALTPGASYWFRAICGEESVQKHLATRAAGPGVPRSVWIESHAVNLNQGESMRVEYGASPALGQSSPAQCAGRCTAELHGMSGEMLYHRTVVLDSAGRVVRRGRIRTITPQ